MNLKLIMEIKRMLNCCMTDKKAQAINFSQWKIH